jgi:hypothetical protein
LYKRTDGLLDFVAHKLADSFQKKCLIFAVHSQSSFA